MELREVCRKCGKLCESARQHPKICIVIGFLLAAILLLLLPPWQVSLHEINNASVEADLENQYRATLAQILGGVAIGATLYYTWRRISIAQEDLKITQENLKIAQEGQITERFTRAVDQLGNEKIEIRLGGIYALERISNESERDYWPIMKILAAYIREKSPIKDVSEGDKHSKEQEESKLLPTDIQVILELICKREHSFNEKIDLRNSNLRKARLFRAHLEWADLSGADIWGADLTDAHLESSQLYRTHLEDASLVRAHLENAHMLEAHLERAYLQGIDLKDATLIDAHLEDVHLENAVLVTAFLEETHFDRAHLGGTHFEHAHLKGAYLNNAQLIGTHLEIANLEEAHLEGANLSGAHLEGAQGLTIDQLSKAKTLYKAQLDPELEDELRSKGFGHLLDDEPDE